MGRVQSEVKMLPTCTGLNGQESRDACITQPILIVCNMLTPCHTSFAEWYYGRPQIELHLVANTGQQHLCPQISFPGIQHMSCLYAI